MAFPGLLWENRWSSAAYHTWNIGPITTVPTAAIRAVLMTSCSRRGTFSTHCCAMKSPAPRRAPNKKEVKVIIMYNTAPNCKGTFYVPWKWWVCTFPPLPGGGGVGFFLHTNWPPAAIDYYQTFITVFYGTRSAVLLTSQYVKWSVKTYVFF